jgi:hypothetical protein
VNTSIAEVSKVNLTMTVVHSFLSRTFEIEVDERFLQDISEVELIIRMRCESQAENEPEEQATI